MLMEAKDANNNGRELRLDSLERLKVGGGYLSTIAFSIALNASVSGPIVLGDARAVRLSMPAAWTAADLYVQTSYDGVVAYKDLYNPDGTPYSFKAAAGTDILLPVVDFLGIGWMKLRAGPAGAPIPQAAQRDFVLQVVGA